LSCLGERHRPIAGGTDLLTLLKPGIVDVDRLVDIRSADLPNMIAQCDDGVRIGALATLAEVARSDLLLRDYPAIAQAAASTATRPIRGRATVGGNLLQRPQCSYYRDPYTYCWLEGGNDCPALDGNNSRHAIFGGASCFAVHPSDLAGALLAFDAMVTLIGNAGRREVPIADFFALPEAGRRTETRIRPDELVLSIRLPRRSSGWRSDYRKVREGSASTFALVGLALAGRTRNDELEDVRIVFTGVAPIPWRHRAAEARLLEGRDAASARRAAIRAIGDDALPLRHNDYKIRLARYLLRRALDRIGIFQRGRR
jgi:xanthine dehydrogenase YagS FAD-binding subunit